MNFRYLSSYITKALYQLKAFDNVSNSSLDTQSEIRLNRLSNKTTKITLNV